MSRVQIKITSTYRNTAFCHCIPNYCCTYFIEKNCTLKFMKKGKILEHLVYMDKKKLNDKMSQGGTPLWGCPSGCLKVDNR